MNGDVSSIPHAKHVLVSVNIIINSTVHTHARAHTNMRTHTCTHVHTRTRTHVLVCQTRHNSAGVASSMSGRGTWGTASPAHRSVKRRLRTDGGYVQSARNARWGRSVRLTPRATLLGE